MSLCVSLPQYSAPVVKYDRNGFRPRLRQLIFTQEAAYLVEESKIKQRIDYSSLKGNQWQKCDRISTFICGKGGTHAWIVARVIKDVFYAGVSVSNLSDNFLIFHVTFNDIKQKVELWTHWFLWKDVHLCQNYQCFSVLLLYKHYLLSIQLHMSGRQWNH